MEKKLLLLLITIPVASLVITWSVFNAGETIQDKINFPEQNNSEKISDTFFNKANIINFSETGIPKSQIIGDQLFHYPGKEDSEIIKPRITLFRDAGSPVDITADHGFINHEGTRLLLKGHTIIKREKSSANKFSQLETPELTIWPDKDYAETDKKVKITSESTIATGVGMKAYLDTEHYLLLNNVKGKHIPAKSH